MNIRILILVALLFSISLASPVFATHSGNACGLSILVPPTANGRWTIAQTADVKCVVGSGSSVDPHAVATSSIAVEVFGNLTINGSEGRMFFNEDASVASGNVEFTVGSGANFTVINTEFTVDGGSLNRRMFFNSNGNVVINDSDLSNAGLIASTFRGNTRFNNTVIIQDTVTYSGNVTFGYLKPSSSNQQILGENGVKSNISINNSVLVGALSPQFLLNSDTDLRIQNTTLATLITRNSTSSTSSSNLTAKNSTIRILQSERGNISFNFSKSVIQTRLQIGDSAAGNSPRINGSVAMGTDDNATFNFSGGSIARTFPIQLVRRDGITPLVGFNVTVHNNSNGNLLYYKTTDSNGFIYITHTFSKIFDGVLTNSATDNLELRIYNINASKVNFKNRDFINMTTSSYNIISEREGVVVTWTGNCDPPAGNWNIDSDVYCLDENWDLTNNVTVKSTGNLTMQRSNFTFAPSSDDHIGLIVESNGRFNASGASKLSSSTSSKHLFKLDSNSNFVLDNFTLDKASGYISRDIAINPGKRLDLSNSILRMNSQSNGEFEINVQGILNITKSEITRAGSFTYDFFVNNPEGFYLIDSTVRFAGHTGGTSSQGIKIDGYNAAQNAQIINTTINSASANGIWILNSDGITLNNTTVSSTRDGLVIESSNTIDVDNSSFTVSDALYNGIKLDQSNSVNIRDPIFSVPTDSYFIRSIGTTSSNTLTVSKTRSYANGNITLAGNVIIPGTLTLDNVNLALIPASNNQYGIDSSGSLRLLNGANVTSSNANTYTFISTGATFIANDTSFNKIGGRGLNIRGATAFEFNRNNVSNSASLNLTSLTGNITNITFISNTHDLWVNSNANVGLVDTQYDYLSGTDGSSKITRYWTTEVFVRNHPNMISQSPIESADVNVTNKTGDLMFTRQTNGAGLTDSMKLIEFVETGSEKANATPHNFIANKTGYSINNTAFNITTTRTNAQNVTMFLSENVAPLYYDNSTNFSTGDSYDIKTYFFRINWTDLGSNISEVKLETNFTNPSGTNYTMIREGGVSNSNYFNYTYSSPLPAGTYYWKSYATDIFGNVNVTNMQVFVINKRALLATAYRGTEVWESLPNPQTVTYITGTTRVNVTLNESRFQENVTLFRDGVELPENPDISYLAARPTQAYSYTSTFDDTQNFTVSMPTRNLNVSKASSSVTLKINNVEGDASVIYPQSVDVDATIDRSNEITNFNLTRNDTIEIDSGLQNLHGTQTLGAGYYKFNASVPETQNYTGASRARYLTVRKHPLRADMYIGTEQWLSVPDPREVTYSTAFTDVNVTLNESGYYNNVQLKIDGQDANVETYRDLRVLAARPETVYVYSSTFADTENFTVTMPTRNLNVTRASSVVTLAINDADSDGSVTYPNSATINATINRGNEISTVKLVRNDTNQINSSRQIMYNTETLGAGYYKYNVSVDQTQNYTGASLTRHLTVNKYPLEAKIYRNGAEWLSSPNPLVVTYTTGSTNVNVTVNDSTYQNKASLQIDGTNANQNAYVDQRALSARPSQVYAYTTSFSDTQNFSITMPSRNLNVSKASSSITLNLNGVNNGPNSIVYPTHAQVTATIDRSNEIVPYFKLKRDTLEINSSKQSMYNDEALAANSYLYNASVDETENYTGSWNAHTLTINKTALLATMYLNNNVWTLNPETFSYTTSATRVNVTINDSAYQNNVILKRDGNTIVNNFAYNLGARPNTFYAYTSEFSDTENFSVTMPSRDLNITRAQSNINLYIDNQQSPVTKPYSTQSTNTTAILDRTNQIGDFKLFRNDVEIGSASNYLEKIETLGAGTYTIKSNISQSENYTSDSEQMQLVIDKAFTLMTLLLNGTDGDKIYNIGEVANLTAYLNVSGKPVKIFSNFTGSDQELSTTGTDVKQNLTNTQSLSLGPYKINGSFNGDENYTSSESVHILRVTDTQAPSISSPSENPASPTVYAPGKTYSFSATVTDNGAVDDVFLEIRGKNYTASPSGNTYTASVTNLPAGSHPYKWYANDTSNNMATLASSSDYVIQKSTTGIKMYLDEQEMQPGASASKTYSAATTNVSANINRTEQLATLKIHSNDAEVASGVSPEEYIATLPAGSYVFKANTTETENYTSATTQFSLTVGKAASVITLTVNGATNLDNTITYPTSANVVATIDRSTEIGSFKLTRNVTTQIGIGTSSITDSSSLGANYYVYNASVDETANYSGGSISRSLTVNKNSTTIRLLINGTAEGDVTHISPATINATITVDYNPSVNILLNRRDGEGTTTTLTLNQIGNRWENISLLGKGSYTYNASFTNENYTASPAIRSVTVSNNPTKIDLTLDGQVSKTYNKGDIANIKAVLNVTPQSPGVFRIYTNYTGPHLVANFTSTLTEITNITNTGTLNLGVYRVIANYSGDDNNDISSNSTILTVEDTSAPTVSIGASSPADNAQINTQSIDFECSFSDNDRVTSIQIFANDTGTWQSRLSKTVNAQSGSDTVSGDLNDGHFIWTCLALDASGNSAFASQNRTMHRDATGPSGTRSQNVTNIEPGAVVLLSVLWNDAISNVSHAKLATNETGIYVNTTEYLSPRDLGNNLQNVWSNFTWANGSIAPGTAVGWRVYANDSWDNWGVTSTGTIHVVSGLAPFSPNETIIKFTDSGSDYSTLTINWTDNSTNENRFWVERGVNGAGYFVVNMTVTSDVGGRGTSYSFTDTGLSSNTNYSYKVYAEGTGGNSTKEFAVNADVPARGYKYSKAQVQDAPTTSDTPNSIRVFIKNMTNPAGTEYHIRVINGTEPNQLIRYVNATNWSASETPVYKNYSSWSNPNVLGLTADTYCFSTAARNKDGVVTETSAQSCATPGETSGVYSFDAYFDPAAVDMPIGGSLTQYLFIRNKGITEDRYTMTVDSSTVGAEVLGSFDEITVGGGEIDRTTGEVQLNQNGGGVLRIVVTSVNDPTKSQTVELVLRQSILGVPALTNISIAILLLLATIALVRFI